MKTITGRREGRPDYSEFGFRRAVDINLFGQTPYNFTEKRTYHVEAGVTTGYGDWLSFDGTQILSKPLLIGRISASVSTNSNISIYVYWISVTNIFEDHPILVANGWCRVDHVFKVPVLVPPNSLIGYQVETYTDITQDVNFTFSVNGMLVEEGWSRIAVPDNRNFVYRMAVEREIKQPTQILLAGYTVEEPLDQETWYYFDLGPVPEGKKWSIFLIETTIEYNLMREVVAVKIPGDIGIGWNRGYGIARIMSETGFELNEGEKVRIYFRTWKEDSTFTHYPAWNIIGMEYEKRTS